MSGIFFFGGILSVLAGVLVETSLSWGVWFAILLLLLAGTLLFLVYRTRGAPRVLFVSFLLLCCALGIMRVLWHEMRHDAHVLDVFLEERVTIAGLVTSDPDVRERYTNLVFDVDYVLYDGERFVSPYTVRVLVRVPHYPEFFYGDQMEITGTLIAPKNFVSEDTGNVFDYQGYLAKDAIYYQMFFPSVDNVTHGGGNIIKRSLSSLKTHFLKTIAKNISEPEASLAGGILLGAKQSLGETLLEKFRVTGLIHIVVLSGYNVAIIATAIVLLMSGLPPRVRFVASVVAVILFAIMVGGGATVVRATIMVLAVLVARAVGREAHALRALLLAAFIMVMMNPAILLHDLSFQLSFIATLSLIVFVPIIDPFFSFIKSSILREISTATLSAQLWVAPLILYSMGNTSVIGFLANLLVLPMMPVAMASVALVLIFGSVPIVGSILSGVSYLSLAYIIGVVEIFSEIPLAAISGVSFSFWGMMAMYAVLAFVVIRKRPRFRATIMTERLQDRS